MDGLICPKVVIYPNVPIWPRVPFIQNFPFWNKKTGTLFLSKQIGYFQFFDSKIEPTKSLSPAWPIIINSSYFSHFFSFVKFAKMVGRRNPLKRSVKIGFGFGHVLNDITATLWFGYGLVYMQVK